MAKKAIEEAFPNILTFITHRHQNFKYFFLRFHYYVPTFFSLLPLLPSLFYLYLPFSTSTTSVLPLSSPILPPTSLLFPPPAFKFVLALVWSSLRHSFSHHTCILSIDVKDLVSFIGRFCSFVVCDASLHEFNERSDRILDHKIAQNKNFLKN